METNSLLASEGFVQVLQEGLSGTMDTNERLLNQVYRQWNGLQQAGVQVFCPFRSAGSGKTCSNHASDFMLCLTQSRCKMWKTPMRMLDVRTSLPDLLLLAHCKELKPDNVSHLMRPLHC